MNLDQLLLWLSKHGITVAEKVAEPEGVVYTFTGTRPFPWDGRPQWTSLAVKTGQTRVAKREIEGILRHFAQGQLEFPKPTDCTAIGVQPVIGASGSSKLSTN
jgi:hypothetical protein